MLHGSKLPIYLMLLVVLLLMVRTPKTLKLKYDSIKKNTKKKAAQNRQEMYKTGGGTAKQETFSAEEEKVLAICTNIDDLEARNDSDLIEESTSALLTPAENATEIEFLDDPADDEQNVQCIEEQIEGASSSKWETWTPQALKTKINPTLKTTKLTKTSVKTKFDALGDSRLELVELQLQVARNEVKYKKIEHELHIQQKKEKHEVRMLYLHNEETRRETEHQLHMQELNNNNNK